MNKTILVVTLIGSVKQKNNFDYYNEMLTKKGYAVFSCGCWNPELSNADENINKVKGNLQAVHRKKIDKSDIVAFIKNLNGTLGQHSMDEFYYGWKKNKIVVDAQNLIEEG